MDMRYVLQLPFFELEILMLDVVAACVVYSSGSRS